MKLSGSKPTLAWAARVVMRCFCVHIRARGVDEREVTTEYAHTPAPPHSSLAGYRPLARAAAVLSGELGDFVQVRSILDMLVIKYKSIMGFESMPKPKAESEDNNEQQDQGGAKVSIGVFEGESDADAIARAKEIDDRLDREGKSESTLS